MTERMPFLRNLLRKPEFASPAVSISVGRKQLRILLVEPEAPRAFWRHNGTMELIGKQASLAPVGLTTLAAMLPPEWGLDLADLNTGPLDQSRIDRADAVFIGGMHVQGKSFHEVARRAREAGKIVVGGGPYVSTAPQECNELNHLVEGEVEGGIDEWTRLFENNEAPHLFKMPLLPDLHNMPPPRYDLIDPNKYYSMGIQLTRGCPFNCEFCSVTELNGRNPRLKTAAQFMAEVEAIYKSGFRGPIFVVDDNLIGNYGAAEEVLDAMIAWQVEHGYPLEFYTQADLRLATPRLDTFLKKMVQAGFSGVFLGIETPDAKALEESKKTQNMRMDLDAAVSTIAGAGLEPMAGFIMGFDADTEKTHDELTNFIIRNPIPQAMIGLLQAAPHTKLAARMEREGRMLPLFGGDQFGRVNFETRMDTATLHRKYAEALSTVYDPTSYFDRCLQLMQMRPEGRNLMIKQRPRLAATALWNSIIKQGLASQYRREYWKFLATVARTMPDKLATGIGHAIKFDHLYTYTHEDVLPGLSGPQATLQDLA